MDPIMVSGAVQNHIFQVMHGSLSENESHGWAMGKSVDW